MTLLEAINLADEQRPNAYDKETKILWLSELDGRIKREIYDTHEEIRETPFTPYTNLFDLNKSLLAPHPYDAIYIHWLYTKIDFMNGENARFNTSALMYNTAWINLANYVNRNYRPLSGARLTGA